MAPAATSIGLLLLPPPLRSSVPAWKLTEPLLLKATFIAVVEPVVLLNVPALLNACPDPPFGWNVAPVTLNTPPAWLLTSAEGLKYQLPVPETATVPAFSSVRSRNTALLALRLSVAPDTITILPVPCKVPPVQPIAPVIVTSPLPETVPPLRVRLGKLCGAWKVTVALLIAPMVAGLIV